MNQLRRAIVFWCIGALLAVTVDRVLHAGLRRVATGPLGVWNAVMDGRAGHPLLVVGSSRAEFHFDCDVLARSLSKACLNAGENATAPNTQAPFLEAYLDRNDAPEIVLVSLDPFGLGVRKDLNDPALYAAHLDDPHLFALVAAHDPTARRARDVPLYSFAVLGLTFTQTALRGLAAGAPPPGKPRFPLLAVDHEWDGSFEAWLKDHPAGDDLPIEPAGVSALEHVLSLFTQRGSRVVLVYSPDWAGARSYLRNRGDVLAAYYAIASLRGLPLLDYSGSAIASDRAMFYNSQHLNARGARAFSEELARDLARMNEAGALAPARGDAPPP